MRSSTAVVAFALGACTTAAVQSPAASTAPQAPPPAESQPPQVWPAISPVVVTADEAERRKAPNDKGLVTFLARGEEAFVARLELDAGAAVPLHRDATEEYIHVLEGSGVIAVDGTRHEIGPGATVYMPAGAEVSYQNGERRLVAIQVFAGPDPAKKYWGWTPATTPPAKTPAKTPAKD